MKWLLPLLFVIPALAQDIVWIDLSGDWKFSSVDNPAFAQPGFDDSSWRSVQLPSNPDLFTRTPAWLRRTVTLAPNAPRNNLVVTLGTIQDVYQVFVNGVQIGASGDFEDFSHASVPRPRSFPIPAAIATGGAPRPITIAIRAKRALFLPPQYRLRDTGPYLITTATQTPWHEGERLLDRQWRSFSLHWLLCGLFAAFSAISVIGWWTERRRTELLWFSAFATAHAVIFYYLVTMLLPAAEISLRGRFSDPLEILICLLYVIFAQFALVATGVRSKWPYWFLWAGCLATQPVPILPYIWALGLTSGVVMFHLRRQWSSISAEDRTFRIVLLAGGVDSAANWVSIFVGATRDQIWIGDYVIARSNLFWCLLALTLLVLLFRRGARDRSERERLSGELAAASAIQRLLLAQPALVDPTLSLEARYLPAQEVGGDFYLVIGGEVLLAGDVSGKGLKAAMVVSLLTGVLRERSERNPGELLRLLNRALHGQTEGGFVTCCAIRFEPGGQLRVANAGHLAPYLDGRELPIPAGLPLGIATGIEYSESAVMFAADATLTVVSDGVVEATSANGELFGFERTAQISMKPAGGIAEAARAWGQNDDITVVTVRRTG
ncbi:MAG TPA: PP2C family protein-serine/threonine phosphatase [Bryobacteraceae bacterium]|nr:PP2C family protein-serine/threonine phosphatase [Bryobacteraceae bacterium]